VLVFPHVHPYRSCMQRQVNHYKQEHETCRKTAKIYLILV